MFRHPFMVLAALLMYRNVRDGALVGFGSQMLRFGFLCLCLLTICYDFKLMGYAGLAVGVFHCWLMAVGVKWARARMGS
jgi:hypothetical protein